MLGPNWARGWIIEDYHLHHARCSAIRLGAPRFIGENRWTNEQVKHGTQREREVVFTALHHGWSRDTVGGHLVQGCHIHDCEQTGICGHLGGIFSVISHNHIHHIHTRRRFGGHEMAGIKLHAPIDVRIEGNHIHDCKRGIWLDWQAQGTRVHRNLIYQSNVDDFYTEVSHGPAIIDHNCFLSATSVKNCSQGSAFIHNLMAGAVTMSPIPIRYTPYHMPHSTAVMGLMTILGGDDRWFNNLFVTPCDAQTALTVEDENADLDQASNADSPYGLACYDEWPRPHDDWIPSGGVPNYAKARLPVWRSGNVFMMGAYPGKNEDDSLQLSGKITWRMTKRDATIRLEVSGLEHLTQIDSLHADCLGLAFQAECPFEDPQQGILTWRTDITGNTRNAQTRSGPFDVGASCEWPYFSD